MRGENWFWAILYGLVLFAAFILLGFWIGRCFAPTHPVKPAKKVCEVTEYTVQTDALGKYQDWTYRNCVVRNASLLKLR